MAGTAGARARAAGLADTQGVQSAWPAGLVQGGIRPGHAARHPVRPGTCDDADPV